MKPELKKYDNIDADDAQFISDIKAILIYRQTKSISGRWHIPSSQQLACRQTHCWTRATWSGKGPIWEAHCWITDSTKNILWYECIKASTDYHGRRWEAWFAPEIPVQNGPWKLEGLPGLILEASDDGGKYTFTATGIQETTKPIIPVYRTDEYEKTDRKGFYKSKRAFIDNPLGSINSQLGGGVRVSANSGNPIFATSEVVDFIETDYR